MIWFTADTHFGHANIIKYCDRPFNSVEEMDDVLIDNINKSVKKDDILYHLGDFARRDDEKYLDRINCKNIHFILGNHDRRIRKKEALQNRFKSVKDLDFISVYGHEIVLCHYSMRTWHKQHYGTWQLYGHSHGQLGHFIGEKSIDVGVDCWAYKPLSIKFIEKLFDEKTYSYEDFIETFGKVNKTEEEKLQEKLDKILNDGVLEFEKIVRKNLDSS